MFKKIFPLFFFVLITSQLYASELETKLTSLNSTPLKNYAGISVLDLQTGDSWSLNGQKPFPMQSVFKFPLGVVILKLVDEGKLSLAQQVTIEPRQFAPFHSPLREDLKGQEGKRSLYEILRTCVANSDNTAADVLIELVGGTEAVDAKLKAMGIQSIHINRMEKELAPQIMGLENYHPEVISDRNFNNALAKVSQAKKQAALNNFLNDQRDTSTPEAMTQFLQRLQKGELLTPDSTQTLLKIMNETTTGPNRLKAKLPKGWTIAHKTGTGPTILSTATGTNDVGIITSPAGKSFAISVFIAGSKNSNESHEKLMRDVVTLVTK